MTRFSLSSSLRDVSLCSLLWVSVLSGPALANIVQDSSFEQVGIANNSFEYFNGGSAGGWFYNRVPTASGGGTGLINAPSLFSAPEPPNGEQLAFLQKPQHSFSQAIALPFNGIFDLSLSVAGRPNVFANVFGDTVFDVFLGSDVIYSGRTATGQPFMPVFQSFYADAGSYQLRIALNETTGDLDQTAFFDDIQIAPSALNTSQVASSTTTSVPTPALLPGLIGFGASLLRRKYPSAEG